MQRRCPDCHTELKTEPWFGVNLDICPLCAGTWFDSGELGPFLQHDPPAMLQVEDQHLPEVFRRESPSTRTCPSCAEPLHGFRYLCSSPVELDSCEKCGGIWVEDGELRKINEWCSSARNQAASPDQHAEAIADMARIEVEHEEFMRRQEAFQGMVTLFGCRHPFGYRWPFRIW